MGRENERRRRRVIKNSRWVATAASVWIQCAVGASYTFGIYSAALKSTQGYDQSTLDTVSVFKDIGANAGVLSGVMYAHVAGGGGDTWRVMAAGAVQCVVGYLAMWGAVAGVVGRPGAGAMCVAMFLAAHGQTFFNTANVVTGVHNFHGYSGTIVGIMKGFLGLSGALLVQVYDTLCDGSPSTFLLILALLPASVTLFLTPFVKIHPQPPISFDNNNNKNNNNKKYLNAFSFVALATAFCIMAKIILQNILTATSSSSSLFHISTFIVLLLVLSSPIAIIVKAHLNTEPEESTSIRTSTSTNTTIPLLSDDEVGEEVTRDMNLAQAMSGLDFWLLSLAMVVGMGSGLATINNMSQLGQSLGYTAAEINSLVSLWSVWNFLGRFGAGYLSDRLLRARGWARPAMIAATLALMSLGHVAVASGFPGNLYVGSVLVGICYGSQWSLMPTITSEIFGVKHMGTIFNTIAIASPIGSYIFSVRVIGYIYDKETDESGSETCLGSRCFMVSFLVMAAVALFGCVVALVLYFRTRRFYHEVVWRRLH